MFRRVALVLVATLVFSLAYANVNERVYVRYPNHRSSWVPLNELQLDRDGDVTIEVRLVSEQVSEFYGDSFFEPRDAPVRFHNVSVEDSLFTSTISSHAAMGTWSEHEAFRVDGNKCFEARKIVFGKSLFLAVGSKVQTEPCVSSAARRAAYSEDGETWTYTDFLDESLSGPETAQKFSIAYDFDRKVFYVLIEAATAGTINQQRLFKFDEVEKTWSLPQSNNATFQPESGSWRTLVMHNDVLHGLGGKIASDGHPLSNYFILDVVAGVGEEFEDPNIPEHLLNRRWVDSVSAKEVIVAVADQVSPSGSSTVSHSHISVWVNGTWTQSTFAKNYLFTEDVDLSTERVQTRFRGVVYGNGVFLAYGWNAENSVDKLHQLLRSEDGKTWEFISTHTKPILPDASYGWDQISFVDGVFVASLVKSLDAGEGNPDEAGTKNHAYSLNGRHWYVTTSPLPGRPQLMYAYGADRVVGVSRRSGLTYAVSLTNPRPVVTFASPVTMTKGLVLEGGLTSLQELTVTKGLEVQGGALFQDKVTMTGDEGLAVSHHIQGGSLLVVGTSTMNDTVNIARGGLEVADTILVGGSITVTGTSTLNDDVTIASEKSLTVGGDLTITGTSTLNDDVTIAANKALTVGGPTTLNGELHVNAASTWNGVLSIDGNHTLTVGTGTTTLGGNLIAGGDVSIAATKTLTVGGETTFNDNVAIAATKTLTVGGETTLNDDVTIAVTKTLTVGGESTFNDNVAIAATKTLTVGGTTTLNDDVTIAADKNLNVGGNLGVAGTSTLNSRVTISQGGLDVVAGESDFRGLAHFHHKSNTSAVFEGNVEFKGQLIYHNTTQVIQASDIVFEGNKIFTNLVGIGGDTNNDYHLAVTGNTKVTGNLDVDENVGIGSDLVVGGESTFNDDVAIAANKQLAVGGNVAVDGTTLLKENVTIAATKTLTVGGDLIVDRTSTLNGDTEITGLHTFTVGTGSTALGGSLAVDGESTFNDNVDIAEGKTLTVGGETTLNDDVTIAANKNLEVGGNLVVDGTTLLQENVTIAATKTLTVGGKTATTEFRLNHNDDAHGFYTCDVEDCPMPSSPTIGDIIYIYCTRGDGCNAELETGTSQSIEDDSVITLIRVPGNKWRHVMG